MWRQDPLRLIPNIRGCFLLNSYVSDSYASFRLIFILLRIWAHGTLKTRGYPCFCSSNDCRRAYFDLSMASNDPTKLRIYFGLSSLPPWFFELEQSRRRDPLDLLTKVNVVVWPERIRVLCSAREDVSCMMLDVYIGNVKVLNE